MAKTNYSFEKRQKEIAKKKKKEEKRLRKLEESGGADKVDQDAPAEEGTAPSDTDA